MPIPLDDKYIWNVHHTFNKYRKAMGYQINLPNTAAGSPVTKLMWDVVLNMSLYLVAVAWTIHIFIEVYKVYDFVDVSQQSRGRRFLASMQIEPANEFVLGLSALIEFTLCRLLCNNSMINMALKSLSAQEMIPVYAFAWRSSTTKLPNILWFQCTWFQHSVYIKFYILY